jgi:hypothetical protein
MSGSLEIIWCYNLEESPLHSQHHENLKSNMFSSFQCVLYKNGKGVLHDVEHKITRTIPWILLSLFKNRNNEMQITESLPCQITTESVEWFMGYIGYSTYGPMQDLLWINMA